MIKHYYSLQELIELDIPDFPKSIFGLRKKAEREKWKFRQRYNYGGGREYAVDSLGEDAKNYILSSQVGSTNEIIEMENKALVQNQTININELKPYQRSVIDARALVLSELDKLSVVCGGINNAILKLNELINSPEVSEELKKAIIKANAKSKGIVKLSRATIFNWRKAVKESGTVLALAQKEVREADWPVWGDALLKLWQRPQKPSLSLCLSQLNELVSDKTVLPSYSAAQRFLKKLPVQIFNKGRYGSRELKKFKAYVSRDTSKLWPSAVYTADGHTFDAEVKNPLTGKPFRPEITTVIDVYTRKVVGWSVDLSERTNSVYMALLRSIITHGIPLIWYVDNGRGFNNHHFDDNLVGLLSRLQIEKKNSIAYNSQARGIGERIHQTIWVRASKELATYMGADMDMQAKQAVFKKTRKEIKNNGGSRLLMEWKEFIDFCTKRVDYYNNQPHRSLPIKLETIDGHTRRRNMTPTEFWDQCVQEGFKADKLSKDEIIDLYRFYEIRKASRGKVNLFNNEYFYQPLEAVFQKDVAVAYDPLDASKVWIHELVEIDGKMELGKFIGEALFNGNKVGYFPISEMEALSKKRAEGRIKRLQGHINDAEEEITNKFLEYRQTDVEEFTNKKELTEAVKPQITKTETLKSLPNLSGDRPVFSNDIVWAKWLLENPEKVSQEDKSSLASMLKKPECIMLFELEDVSIQELKMLTKNKDLTADTVKSKL